MASLFKLVALFIVVAGGVASARPPSTTPSAHAADQAAASDIVIRASDVSQSSLHGTWTLASDPTSPNGLKLATADAGVEGEASLGDPHDYFDVTFTAPADIPYRLWLRLSGGDDSRSPAAVWVQFSDSELSGAPGYRTGTSDALLVSLESCSGCPLTGWGWQGSSALLQQSAVITFAATGAHRMRIIARDGGVQLDQVVLSPVRFMRAAPGAPRDDRTTVVRNDETDGRTRPGTEDQ